MDSPPSLPSGARLHINRSTASEGCALQLLALILYILCGALAPFKTAAADPSKGTPPPFEVCKDCNVIIVSSTNTIAKHLTPYGYSRDTTPRINELATSGITLQNAFSSSSWTLPSGISIFSSTYPMKHGVVVRTRPTPPPGVVPPPDLLSQQPDISHLPMITDALESAGYRTMAAHGGFDYSPQYGLTSRFDEAFECTSGIQHLFNYGSLGCSVPKALEWIEKNKDSKFFLFVQGFDTHCPFALPTKNDRFTRGLHSDLDFTKCYWTFDTTQPIKMNGEDTFPVLTSSQNQTTTQNTATLTKRDIDYMTALYDGEINEVDTLVGTLLDKVKALALDSKTIVVFLSEHGDVLGKHGRFMRGGPLHGTFYDEVLNIPVIIRNPRLPHAPRHLSQLIESIDIAPTLLEMVGLPSPPTFTGQSFVPLLRDPTLPGRASVFAASMFIPEPGNLLFDKANLVGMIRTREWKYIEEFLWPMTPELRASWRSRLPPPAEKRAELYDIRTDPGELTDLSQQTPKVRENLSSELDLNQYITEATNR